ncbi:putative leucine-rich repeat domain superfamily [Helianthus annuus]|nr:putative leucine-rich repeat domain superfamily [Helianthus annuus]
MKSLTHLHLSHCIRVEKWPEELGSLECLKELGIEGTAIHCLPWSIYQVKDLCFYGSSGDLELRDWFLPDGFF